MNTDTKRKSKQQAITTYFNSASNKAHTVNRGKKKARIVNRGKTTANNVNRGKTERKPRGYWASEKAYLAALGKLFLNCMFLLYYINFCSYTKGNVNYQKRSYIFKTMIPGNL